MPSPYDPTQAPNLGYGQRGEAPINTVNQWMRGQPWYQALLKSFGQDPNNVHLTDSQKQQVIRAAQANGVIVDEGHNGQEVDDSGNFQAKSHALRNTLIVGGLAAATLLTAGAAGAAWGIGPAVGAGGAGAATGSAAAGAGAAALGPSTAANIAATAGIVGGGSVPASLATAATSLGISTAGLSGMEVAKQVAAKSGASPVETFLKYGLPIAGNLAGNLIQANASGKASDASQKYLEEALAYQKEKDSYDRKDAAAKYSYGANLEASRYGDYSNRIAPYVASGSSANARMAQLLGLSPSAIKTVNRPAPPPPPSAPFPAASAAPAPSAPAPSAAAPSTAPPPNAAAPMVTMQGPDGSQKQVPASQVDYWKAKGASVAGAAA